MIAALKLFGRFPLLTFEISDDSEAWISNTDGSFEFAPEEELYEDEEYYEDRGFGFGVS